MALRLACATGVPWVAFCVVCVLAAAAFLLSALSEVVDEATRSSRPETCVVVSVDVREGPAGFCARLEVRQPPGGDSARNVSVDRFDKRCDDDKEGAEKKKDEVTIPSEIPCFVTGSKPFFGLLPSKISVAETEAKMSVAKLGLDVFALLLAVFLMWVFLRYFVRPLVQQRWGGEQQRWGGEQQVVGAGVERARGMAKAEADARLEELEDSSVNAVEDVCSICLEDGVNGKRRVVMPACRHTFHVDCIGKWLMGGRQDCPECRQSIFGDDGGSDVAVDIGRVSGEDRGRSSGDDMRGLEAEGPGGAGLTSLVGSSSSGGVDTERSDVVIDMACAESEGSERSAVEA